MNGELFTAVSVRRPVPVRSLAASLTIHAVVVVLLVSWRSIGPLQELRYVPRKAEVQMIRYNLTEPLLFAAEHRESSGGAARAAVSRKSPATVPARRFSAKDKGSLEARIPAPPVDRAPPDTPPPPPKLTFQL